MPGTGPSVDSTALTVIAAAVPGRHADPLEVQVGPADRYYRAIRFRARSSMRGRGASHLERSLAIGGVAATQLACQCEVGAEIAADS